MSGEVSAPPQSQEPEVAPRRSVWARVGAVAVSVALMGGAAAVVVGSESAASPYTQVSGELFVPGDDVANPRAGAPA